MPNDTQKTNKAILYHQIWRALLHGSSTRLSLPAELVATITRYADLMVPDPARTVSATGPKVIYASGQQLESRVWFRTPPLAHEDVAQVVAMQLSTNSRDQGWVNDRNAGSWSWFDIGIAHNDSYDGDASRRICSHYNRLAGKDYANLEGALTKAEDIQLEVGAVICVYMCAQFGAWRNDAQSGQLKFWKSFEPVIPL